MTSNNHNHKQQANRRHSEKEVNKDNKHNIKNTTKVSNQPSLLKHNDGKSDTKCWITKQ